MNHTIRYCKSGIILLIVDKSCPTADYDITQDYGNKYIVIKEQLYMALPWESDKIYVDFKEDKEYYHSTTETDESIVRIYVPFDLFN